MRCQAILEDARRGGDEFWAVVCDVPVGTAMVSTIQALRYNAVAPVTPR